MQHLKSKRKILWWKLKIGTNDNQWLVILTIKLKMQFSSNFQQKIGILVHILIISYIFISDLDLIAAIQTRETKYWPESSYSLDILDFVHK